MSTTIRAADRLLVNHLASWLGRWPPARQLEVVGSLARVAPGWDGAAHPVLGVASAASGVLSVPPELVAAVTAVFARGEDLATAGPAIPALAGYPDRGWYNAVFRWSDAPARLADTGQWLPVTHPAVPPWLRPFGGDVLLALDSDDGTYLAGVGIKRHDAYGHELSVGTVAAARGRGLARRLVAQAARRVLDEGALPTYLHAADNVASARVAEAAGFPARGWTSFGVSDE